LNAEVATAAAVARPRFSRRAAPLALAAGGGTLALLAVAVGAAFPEESPLSPDHSGGTASWAWLYLGALIGAFCFYLLGLRVLTRRAARLAPILVVACLIQVVALVGPVLLSTDVYTYWAYGRVGAVHGENPYEVPPAAFPDDPAYDLMGADWRDTTSVYGPVFTLGSEGVAFAAGDSSAAAAWTFRGVAAAAMIALAVLAAGLSSRPALACAFVGWNPLLAVHFAGGGHNDAAMMALVLGALALAAASRLQLAGGLWAFAIAVKWIPAVFLLLRAVEARAVGRSVRHLGFALAAGVIAAVAFWRYGTGWLEAVVPLAHNLEKQAVYSIPHRLSGLGISEDAAAVLLGALFAIALVWLLREAWRGRARLGLAAGLLLLATPWLVPWYAVWAVPLAAFEEDRTARLLALGLSAYLLRDAVPL
jgi:alpha-1,6-mannosyltransferase